jgi:hypothetical protein
MNGLPIQVSGSGEIVNNAISCIQPSCVRGVSNFDTLRDSVTKFRNRICWT